MLDAVRTLRELRDYLAAAGPPAMARAATEFRRVVAATALVGVGRAAAGAADAPVRATAPPVRPVDRVLADVGSDPRKAAAALAEERTRAHPRWGVVAPLEAFLRRLASDEEIVSTGVLPADEVPAPRRPDCGSTR